MPLHYARDDAKRRIEVTSIGRVTLDDVLAVINRQAAEGVWSYGVLYDNRAAEGEPTAADAHRMLMRVGVLTTKHGPRGPVALVVRDQTRARAGKRYANMGDLTALNVRVFENMSDAERWLDEHQ
jgi:hypothetical protein